MEPKTTKSWLTCVFSSLFFILLSGFSLGFSYWFYFQGVTFSILYGGVDYFQPDSMLVKSVFTATLMLSFLWIIHSALVSRILKTSMLPLLKWDALTYLPLTILLVSAFKYIHYTQYAGISIILFSGACVVYLKARGYQRIKNNRSASDLFDTRLIVLFTVPSLIIFSLSVLPVDDVDRDGFQNPYFSGLDCNDFNERIKPTLRVEEIKGNDIDENCDGQLYIPGLKENLEYNVILLVVDTLGADHLGFMGYSRNTSPQIDGLAGKSTIFSDTISASSCTFPAVNTILTSKPPSLFYAIYNSLGSSPMKFMIPEPTPTLPGLLKSEGYYTKAVISSQVVDKILVEGKGSATDDFHHIDNSCLKKKTWKRGYKASECTTRRAVEWMGRNQGQPFFMFLHYIDPHHPYKTPPPYDGLYSQYVSLRDDVNSGNPELIRDAVMNGSYVNPNWEDLDHLKDSYDSEIRYLDENIGELIDMLGESGLMENTIIIFTSDHGEAFLEHEKSILHCSHVHREQIKIPFFIYLPWDNKPKQIEGPASSSDILPTLLDILGLDHPSSELEGITLKPFMEGEENISQREVFFDLRLPWSGNKVFLRGVQNEKVKIILDENTGEYFGFDRSEDEYELTPIGAFELGESKRLVGELNARIRREDYVGGADLSNQQLDEGVLEALRSLGYIS